MAIGFNALTKGTGTTITLPTHAAGDLLVLFTYRDGGIMGTAPSDGSGGGTWLEELPNTATSSNSSRVQYLICSTSSHTATGATVISMWICVNLSGTHTSDPIGGTSHAGGVATNIPYAAISMDDSSGSSWVLGFAGHRSIDVALETPPTNMSFRDGQVDATCETAAHDTNGGVTGWTLQTVTGGGTSSGYRVAVLEIKAAGGGGGPVIPVFMNQYRQRAA